MRIEHSNVLRKNIRSILENLESLCEYFNMEANIHISKSGDSGYIDAFTEKSLTSFEADINSDILLMITQPLSWALPSATPSVPVKSTK